MHFDRLKNRIKRIGAQVSPPPHYNRVVCLYIGESEQDAIEQLKASNNGVLPPPATSGPDYILVRVRRRRPI